LLSFQNETRACGEDVVKVGGRRGSRFRQAEREEEQTERTEERGGRIASSPPN